MENLNENVLDELQEQNKLYTSAYWDIYDNKEAMPADQQERMRAELLKYYARAVALLDGQAGLAKEQEITELNRERLKIQEEARLHEEKIKADYRLKHVLLTAQTDAQSARIKKEFEIKQQAEIAALDIKREQIVPIKEELPKRWWERLFRRPVKYFTNYAYELASSKANLEAEKEFAYREEEILKLEAEQTGTDELKLAIIKIMTEYSDNKLHGRKAKAVINAFTEVIEPLCAMVARRERALNELIGRLSESGDNALNNEPQEQQDGAEVREELQSRAVTLLKAFCQKRIDELQTDQIKPKRKRIRKSRTRQERTND